jgi:hypothetical protein
MAAPFLMQKYRIPAEYEGHVDAFLELAGRQGFSHQAIDTALQFASEYRGDGTPEDVITSFDTYAAAKGVAENFRNDVLGFYDDIKTKGVPAPEAITAESLQEEGELKAEIEEMLGDKNSPYWKGANSEALQHLYYTILEREEKAVNASAHNERSAATTANINRLNEIESKFMRAPKGSDNWKQYWKSDDMRNEYLTLLEKQTAPPQTAPTQTQTAPQHMGARGLPNQLTIQPAAGTPNEGHDNE